MLLMKKPSSAASFKGRRWIRIIFDVKPHIKM